MQGNQWTLHGTDDGSAFLTRKIGTVAPGRLYEAVRILPVNGEYWQYNRTAADLDDWTGTRAGKIRLEDAPDKTQARLKAASGDAQIAAAVLEWLACGDVHGTLYLNTRDARQVIKRVLGRPLEDLFPGHVHTDKDGNSRKEDKGRA